MPDARPPLTTGPLVTFIYRVAADRREALLEFFREAFPFYERPGGVRMALYESFDDPGLFVELVAYADEGAYRRDQERVEHDPEMLAVLGRFKALVGGPVEVRRIGPVPLPRR